MTCGRRTPCTDRTFLMVKQRCRPDSSPLWMTPAGCAVTGNSLPPKTPTRSSNPCAAHFTNAAFQTPCTWTTAPSTHQRKSCKSACGWGCQLIHAPVRDGAAKGKVERFFRTVRPGFLTRALDLSSIDALNRAFFDWVEESYNARNHSTLGMRPIDRFGLDLSRIRFLPPSEANDEMFFVEEERTVKADNTFSFKSMRFEAPRDLRSRKVQIRHNRLNFEKAIVVYKGERMGEAREVDFIANDRPPKRKDTLS